MSDGPVAATTTIDFAMFNMAKPSLARLLSVDDKIHLEIEFKTSSRNAIGDCRKGHSLGIRYSLEHSSDASDAVA